LVRLAEELSDRIQVYDKRIEKLGHEKYEHTELLRQVKGVGPLTSLAYVLTLENPDRFRKSRDVGPYVGLVPQQEDSGDSQPQLRISKTGDVMLRRLLVGSAHYILGPFGPDTDLRRYGLRLCEKGGKNAKKRRVQQRLAYSVGGRPTGVRVRNPVAWIAGRKETETPETYRQSHL